MSKKPQRASELEWLQFFYGNADFGPAHEDVVAIIQEAFKQETGKLLPKGYYDYDTNEENDD